jgi:hypothetical protein
MSKNFFSIVLVIVLCVCMFCNAFADYAIKWSTPKFITSSYNLTYYYAQLGSKDWSSKVAAGATAWCVSNAPVWIAKGTSSKKNMYVISFNAGNVDWNAMHDTRSADFRVISLNEYRSIAYTNGAEATAHEMGHALRLNDVNELDDLMRWYLAKGSPTVTSDEVAGVKVNYP